MVENRTTIIIKAKGEKLCGVNQTWSGDCNPRKGQRTHGFFPGEFTTGKLA